MTTPGLPLSGPATAPGPVKVSTTTVLASPPPPSAPGNSRPMQTSCGWKPETRTLLRPESWPQTCAAHPRARNWSTT